MSDEIRDNQDSFEQDDDLNALTEGDIIEMIGDDGETVSFIFVDALEYEGDVYLYYDGEIIQLSGIDGEFLSYAIT